MAEAGYHDNTKQRIVQELVPGRQITLAHIIANPDISLYEKLGLEARRDRSEYGSETRGMGGEMIGQNTALINNGAIGVLTVTPSETVIILADIAIKASGAGLGFVDRVNGSLVINGTVSEVEASMAAVMEYSENRLHYEVCEITKT